MGSGSGTIIKSEGIILTNYHVVKGYDRVTVRIENRGSADGTVVGYDVGLDIAVVKIEGGPWTYLPVSTHRPSVGDEILAIGYPLGLPGESTVTKGLVSAFRPESRFTWVQTDAAINPGNSGGTALTTDGRFIGVPTAKITDGENLGLLIGLFSVENDITRLLDVKTEYRLFINGMPVPAQNKLLDVSAGTITLNLAPRPDGTYPLNTSITMAASAPPGYEVIWGGVDSVKGAFGTVKMNSDRFVEVDMLLLPTPQATATRISIPPTPTPRATLTSPVPSGQIAPIDGSVVGLKFFESPFDIVKYGSRVYSNYFSRSTARYILWELNGHYPAPGRRIDFVIDYVIYQSDGAVFGQTSLNTYVQPDWKGSFHTHGWGWSEAENWPIDTYRLELSVEGQLIARGFFTVAP